MMKKRLLGLMLGLSVGISTVGCALQDAQTSGTEVSSDVQTASASEGESSDTIKVGILHSLSGTMAISETSVKDAELLAIKEINANGGVLGKQIEPVIEDGASDNATFAEKAQKLVTGDQVAAVFGCWTSASRKAVIPVFEEYNALLWYPVQYEGMESSKNVFYMGASPNQQIVPAIEYLTENYGKKIYLLGSDYVFPRTANSIIKAQSESLGAEVVGEEYTAMGHTDYSTLVTKIKQADPDVIFNTLNGDSNVAFFKQLADAGITADQIMTCSVSVAEEEIKGIGVEFLEGHLVSWNYYQTTDTEKNKEFVAAYQAEYGDDRVTADPIEAAYTAVYLWAAAVEKAQTTDVDEVRKAAAGMIWEAPEGTVTIDGDNQHLYKKVRIGIVNSEGMIDEVHSTPEPVKPDPYLEAYEWAKAISES